MKNANIGLKQRKRIEQAYNELEEVRKMLKILHYAKDTEGNEYYDSLSAEENRLIRFISNIKGLNEPNMN